MTLFENPCEARFREAAPRALYETLWRYLDTLYPQEFRKAASEYRFEAGMTVLPHQRRARIETDLPALMHKLGLKSTVERFPCTTDTFILVHINNDVQLIVCYVRNRKAALRYAQARSNLTDASNQPYLLTPEARATVLHRNTLFGILLHSPAPKDHGRFETGTFIFPKPQSRDVLGQLDLKEEMERVQAEDAAAASAVQRTVEIKIKKGG